MNNVIICGRIGKIKKFNNALKLNIATQRGKNDTEWVSCIAFKHTAEFIEKYFNKGKWIGITGRVRQDAYTSSDGTKKYTQDVIIETAQFIGAKESNVIQMTNNQDTNQYNDFEELPQDEAIYPWD